MVELNKTQRDLIEEFAECCDNASVYKNYIGRCMHKPCFGITSSDVADVLIGLGMLLMDEGEDDIAEKMRGCARMDNMGRDTIVYFPSISWGAPDDEE